MFDDYRSSAQSVNSVSVGNGNLEYTAMLDTTNNRHTVRFESYTSFNMPKEYRYGNLTGPSCPAGYTLAPSTLGEICVKANAVTFAATVTYSCAPGQTLSGSGAGSICTGTVVTPARERSKTCQLASREPADAQTAR